MDFSVDQAASIISDKILGWVESITLILPNVIVAIIVLTLFIFLAKLTKNVANRIFSRFKVKETLNNLFSSILYLAVISVGLIIALNVLNLQQTVSSLLAGAGIIGLALGFAFQDLTANLISGVIIALRKPVHVGDIIETKDYFGKIQKIDLRVTILQTFQGLHVIIPNKNISQNPLINYTKTNERRIDLDVGVSYGDDLTKVKEVVLEAIKGKSYVLKNKSLDLVFKEFGSSSINFTLMFWIEYPDEPGYLTARSDAIMTIKKVFDENGITIPFPIRTLDFGIKGGKKLEEMEISTNNLN